MKWEADINGDGKSEVFLSLKEEYDRDAASPQSPGWFVYIADGASNYTASSGVKNDGENETSRSVPMIDLRTCFVGQVTELGQRALITQQIENPRVGDPIARIYAYTVEGDHLKRTKLAEYNPMKANALFDKYLKEGRRTIITLVEVTR